MTHLSDILDPALLHQEITDGFVRERRHPTLPITIYNYAEKTAYDRHWNPTTLACRGLVVADDGTVAARPWAKFFNLSEHGHDPAAAHLPILDPHAPVEVTDKSDGSLGILILGHGPAFLSTRGSFLSDQALHASALYQARYDARWSPNPGLTHLFEIVYPGNRIVLDYAGMDDLILLGAVDTATGRALGPNDPELAGWPGPRTAVFPYASLVDALAAEPRPNAEGFVIRYVDAHPPVLVKSKQADYVILHRAVTGLTERVVWEACGPDGIGFDALLIPLPDEFVAWATRVRDGLLAEQAAQVTATTDAYDALVAELGGAPDRKAFAQVAARHPARALLFLLFDGKDIAPTVWKGLRPSADTAPRAFSEDAA